MGAPGDMPSYIEAGNVVAMDDYWEVDTKKDDYVEAVLDNCYFDGTCYGVPFQVFTQILYWNKDLFTKAGLDPETPPTTWDEVREFSEKITDKANGIYGLGIPNDAQLFDMTRTYGGTYVDGTTHKNMVGETKDGIKEAYTFFQGMIKDGLNPSQVTGPDMDTLFTAGTIGMYQNGPWQIAGNTEKGVNFGVGAVPSGPAGQFVDMGMNNFSILKGITDEQKAAVYEFIRWWQRDGAAKRWCTANKFPTYLKSLASDPEIVADPICNVTTSFIEKGELQYKVPMKNITVLNNDYINKAIGNLMDGQDVDSIIATLESDIDAYLAEYEPEVVA